MVDPEALIGYIVDNRYFIRRVVGVGTFATVYAAEEINLGRSIGWAAVKVLWSADERARQAVRDEIRAMGQLSHAHVIGYRSSGAIGDGVASGSVYMAMDLASESLADRIRRGRLDRDGALEVALHIGEALVFLASHSAVHSDLKPANILRVGDVWKLGDFGLVRAAGTAGERGTVRYRAPEASRNPTPKSDVWSLGVTLQEALTGVFPYEGATDMAVIASMLRNEPTIAPNLPPGLDEIVRGCLCKDEGRRMSARDVVSAAKRAMQDEKPDAARASETVSPSSGTNASGARASPVRRDARGRFVSATPMTSSSPPRQTTSETTASDADTGKACCLLLVLGAFVFGLIDWSFSDLKVVKWLIRWLVEWLGFR